MGLGNVSEAVLAASRRAVAFAASANKKIMAAHASMKWRYAAVPRKTKKALDAFSKQEWLAHGGWYLAGGTALSLQAGHRVSYDLDFFTPRRGVDTKKVMDTLAIFKDAWHTDVEESGTLYGRLMDVKVSFISYPFFVPKQPLRKHGTIRVLQPRDIGVMKIVAVSQRGRKRDFFDLYWCAHHVEPLEALIRRLPEQYPSVAHNFNHILSALIYFKDAEGDPEPVLRFDAQWEGVKQFFEKEVPRIAKAVIGLR